MSAAEIEIKVGTGVTQNMWTDRVPFEVVRVVSDKCLEIRAMKAELGPSWSPEIIPGGFAGHCVNQSEQRWILTSDPSARTIRIRKVAPHRRSTGGGVSGDWGCGRYDRFVVGEARKFHDYNF